MKMYLQEIPTKCNRIAIRYKSGVKMLKVSRSEKLKQLVLSGLDIEAAFVAHILFMKRLKVPSNFVVL